MRRGHTVNIIAKFAQNGNPIQRPDRELVTRHSNHLAVPRPTCRPQPAVTNVTPHHSTAHIAAGEQQTTPENRLLHTGVGVITAAAKTAPTLLKLCWNLRNWP